MCIKKYVPYVSSAWSQIPSFLWFSNNCLFFSRSDKVEMFWRTATASLQNLVFTCKALSRRWDVGGFLAHHFHLVWCGVYVRIETQAFTVFMCVLGFFVESSPLTAHYCSVGTFIECLLCTTEQYREEQNVLPSFYAKCLFLARFLIFLLCIMHFYAPIVLKWILNHYQMLWSQNRLNKQQSVQKRD